MMPFTSVGYDGTIDEVQWAWTARNLGVQYGVAGAGDMRVTAVSGADRTVSIAPGQAFGHGVTDINGAETAQGAIVTSGSRWDTLVIHRDWQPPTGATSYKFLTGTSTRAIAQSRQNEPGVVDDQPIALVQFTAGQQLPTGIIDLRCWHGDAGLVAASIDALSYLDRMGSRVVVQSSGLEFVRRLDAQQNPVWQKYPMAQAWTARRNTSDSFAAGAVGTAASLILPSTASGGVYLVTYTVVATSPTPVIGYLRGVWQDGSNVTGDDAFTIDSSRRSHTATTVVDHPGGSVYVAAQVVGAGAVVTVHPGSRVTASWQGN